MIMFVCVHAYLYCCQICIKVNGQLVLSNTTAALRDVWEETSFQLDQLQTDPACVVTERRLLQSRLAPSYFVSFNVKSIMSRDVQPPVPGCGTVLAVLNHNRFTFCQQRI